MKIAIIVAAAKDRVIGHGNTIPWHSPADLQYFKRTTMGAPVIMGRKTYDSLKIKPLPGRQNIIVTRDEEYKCEDCDVVHSLEAAYAAAGEAQKVFVIGGADIYAQVISIADELYITDVLAEVEGDRYFPEFSLDEWRLIGSEHYSADDKNPFDMQFKKFIRQS